MSVGSATGHPAAVESAARLIKIDAEHFAIRFLLPALTLGAVLMFHFGGLYLISRWVEGVSPLCIVLPGDVLLLWVGGMGIERALKRLLPSKRHAVLDAQGLVVTDARQQPPQVARIAWDRAVYVKAWRFTVRRRGRVPRGWYCMALYLLQDEDEVIVYSFMAPKEAEALPGYGQFTRLRPRKETQSNTDWNAVAEQRRLLKLEDRRWMDGGEIAQADLRALVMAVARAVPEWQVSSRAR